MGRAVAVFAILVAVAVGGCSSASSDRSAGPTRSRHAARTKPLSAAPPSDNPKYLAKLSGALDAKALLSDERGVFGRVNRLTRSGFQLTLFRQPSSSGDIETISVLPAGLRHSHRIAVTVSRSTKFSPVSTAVAGLPGHDVFVGGRFSNRTLDAEAIADLGEPVDRFSGQTAASTAGPTPELLNFDLGPVAIPASRATAEGALRRRASEVEDVARLRFDYRSPRLPSVNVGGSLQFGPSCPKIRAEAKVVADAHEEAHFNFDLQRTGAGFALVPTPSGPFANEQSYANPQRHPDRTTFYSGYGVGLALKFSVSCSVWGFKKSFDFTLAEITALLSSYTHQPPPLDGSNLIVPTNDCLVLKSEDYGPFRALSHIPKLNKYANLEVAFCVPISVVGAPVAYHLDDRSQTASLVALAQGASVRLDSFSYAPHVKRSIRIGIAVGTKIARDGLLGWANGTTSIGFNFPTFTLFTEALGPLRTDTRADVAPLPTTTTTTTRPPPLDVRSVDFNNRSYESQLCVTNGPVQVVNGHWNNGADIAAPGSEYCSMDVGSVDYADLSGDGVLDAVVNLESGTAGNAVGHTAVLFVASEGALRTLGYYNGEAVPPFGPQSIRIYVEAWQPGDIHADGPSRYERFTYRYETGRLILIDRLIVPAADKPL